MMNKRQQRRVWQRVYPGGTLPHPVSREQLQQAIQRLQQNLRIFGQHTEHNLYGPAFQHLQRQTQEQVQMLRQILEGER